MIDPTAYIHPLAFVCGGVALGPGASVWPFAVVRGDNERIAVGAESNVQDGAVLHADPGVPCTLGTRVSVGHRAVVREGASVEPGVLAAGVPARAIRALTADERERLARTAAAYLRLGARHRAGEFPGHRYVPSAP